jgi:nucleoside-diphosphate-sugar epimerase
MRIAVSGNDGFIAPHLLEMLGDVASEIPSEALDNPRLLDGALASCTCLIHFNGHPPNSEIERNDPDAPRLMKEWARGILDAKKRHQGLHLILVGSLRVHPEYVDERFSGETTLSPRDATAEGQLWVEERALENATEDSPVSILRVSNVHGLPVGGGKGRGYLHSFAGEALTGWIGVPGDGQGMKEIIHVADVCSIIAEVAHSPPPTREALAMGNGWATPISELAEAMASKMGADVQMWAPEKDELWGVVEVGYLKERLKYEPMVGMDDIIQEAMANASF